MKSIALVAALALLSGCPDDPAGNPDTLWLSPDRVETEVKLAAKEPPPW